MVVVVVDGALMTIGGSVSGDSKIKKEWSRGSFQYTVLVKFRPLLHKCLQGFTKLDSS